MSEYAPDGVFTSRCPGSTKPRVVRPNLTRANTAPLSQRSSRSIGPARVEWRQRAIRRPIEPGFRRGKQPNYCSLAYMIESCCRQDSPIRCEAVSLSALNSKADQARSVRRTPHRRDGGLPSSNRRREAAAESIIIHSTKAQTQSPMSDCFRGQCDLHAVFADENLQLVPIIFIRRILAVFNPAEAFTVEFV